MEENDYFCNQNMAHTLEEMKRYRTEMINNPSVPEVVAKFCLNSLKKKDYYHTQVILGYFIVDFTIPSKMLIIEIDGQQHSKSKQYDIRRDKFCNDMGFRVCRIPASDAHLLLDYLKKYKDIPKYKTKYNTAIQQATKLKKIQDSSYKDI